MGKRKTITVQGKNINISIKENENVAIIGQIGSGKSTLVKLLLKFFEPTSGSIEINNVKLRKISRDNLYDHVFYIPQKPKLLNRTLYENIFYGFDPQERDKEENIERVKDILKDMQIEENIIDIFMEKMDQNYLLLLMILPVNNTLISLLLLLLLIKP